MATMVPGRRRFIICALFTSALGFAGSVAAQVPGTGGEARWAAFLGCWRSADTPPDAPSAVLCVVPATAGAGVDVVSFVDAKEVSRQTFDGTGDRGPLVADGCEGWGSSSWSSDNRRVFLRSDLTCAGGLQRVSTGVLTMSPESDLLEIQSVTAGGGTGVRVNRYRDAGIPADLPADIGSALAGRQMAASAARVAAGAPITPLQVVEASRVIHASVLQALLLERGQPFQLSAKALVSLADAGVPAVVTDAMVAVSYPRTFSLGRSGESGGSGGAMPESGAYGGVAGSAYPRSRCSALAGGIDPWDPYWSGYSMYELASGCGSYGYSRYGRYDSARYGYGSWYWNRSPYVIVAQSGTTAQRGQAVKGQGYTRRGGSAATGSSTTSAGSSGGTTARGSSSGSSGSSGSTGSTGRTAKPRP